MAECCRRSKVWLNGVEVFAQEAKQTRQYNQYNISDYSRYLRKGSNLLKIEVKDSKEDEIRLWVEGLLIRFIFYFVSFLL